MTDPDAYAAARLGLQRVSTHVLARARFDADGRFGLRVTPGGVGTPAFGPDGTVLRIAGRTLIREFRQEGTARSATAALTGRSLRELADFGGVDPTSPFSVGSDTPEPGDVDGPVDFDAREASDVMAWLGLGAVALDRLLPDTSDPSVAQVWPEHFDIGMDVATDHGRVNLGASPGDDDHPGPYLYVAPWEGHRPGDPSFWNASFGAIMTRRDGLAIADHVDDAVTFFRTGLRLLAKG